MDTHEIFNGYLTGEERENAIAIAEANNMIDKGFALLEMCIIQEAQMIKDAELKVFKESGTYDDYGYLVSEAQAQATENKKGAFATIIDGISSLIKSLFNSIRGIFKKADPEATVEIDKDTNGALAWIDKASSSISSLGDSIAKGESIPDIIKKIGVPTAAASGAVVTVKVLNDKYDILDKAFKKVDGGIQTIKNLGKDFLDKHPKVNEGLNTVQNFLNTHISPLLNKIGGYVGKAATAVKDGVNAVKDKAGEVVDGVKSKVTGNNNQEQQDVSGNANVPQGANPPQQPGAPTQPVGIDLNQQNDRQVWTPGATNPNEKTYTIPGDQRGYKYTINLQGRLIRVVDANNNPVNITPNEVPQGIYDLGKRIVANGKFESVSDYMFDEDYYTMEFSEEDEAYIVTDIREPELTIEQSIYGESEEIEDEESLADLFDSL